MIQADRCPALMKEHLRDTSFPIAFESFKFRQSREGYRVVSNFRSDDESIALSILNVEGKNKARPKKALRSKFLTLG